jgi:hypothetical protein
LRGVAHLRRQFPIMLGAGKFVFQHPPIPSRALPYTGQSGSPKPNATAICNPANEGASPFARLPGRCGTTSSPNIAERYLQIVPGLSVGD